MTFKLTALIVSFISCVLLATGATRPQESAAAPITGVSYVDQPDALTMQRVERSGATMIHTWIYWKFIAPSTEPENWNPRNPLDPNYNWGTLDEWVKNAKSAGLVPLIQIHGAPTWANRCVTNPKYDQYGAPCDPDAKMLADFGYALARRFDGRTLGLPRVKFFQPQNEPNLALFFGPQRSRDGKLRSPSMYRKILNTFYDAVKSVNPTNKVVSAGLAPNKNSAVTAPLEFARKLLCMKGRKKPVPTRQKCSVKMDIFDMHPYTSGSPTHRAPDKDSVQMGDLRKLKVLLAAADKAGRIKGDSRHTPLWITEMSWDSNPPDPGGVPMRLLERWTSEVVYRAWQAGVSRFFWYSLRDLDPNGQAWSLTTQSGLYFRGDTVAQDRPKPILRAFAFPFVAYKNGNRLIYIWGRNRQSTRGWVSIQKFSSGHWRKLVAVRADKGGMFKRNIRVKPGSNGHGSLRAVFHGQTSVPFSLTRPRDRQVRPFG